MNAKDLIKNAGYVFAGVGIIVLPVAWVFLFALSSFSIVGNPALLWYTNLWLIGAATWLLFFRKGNAQRRFVLEVSVWLASVGLLIAGLLVR
ncbi:MULTISPECIES: hypothetical protein [unclassified Xanthomonas]|uniref:hypothetical protein n=1 Tax=unclassified Xanthomonas TaxID=2643310 RepID=UPI0011B09FE7|nr:MULTISPECIES: hypothetical protein [unclassified Xanthomonas]